VQTYVPGSAAGDGYFIVNNEYDGTAQCAEWACQVKFDSLFDTVSNDAAGFTTAPMLTLQRDRWMRYTAIVDLANDVYWDYYGSDLLSNEYNGNPLGWATNNALGGAGCNTSVETLAIANIDLFTNGADGQLMDDVRVHCYADCDANGAIDVFDFLCFQDLFVGGDVIADCDGNQSIDVFDFLCYQDLFVSGCG
jgi:hypothetical protein